MGMKISRRHLCNENVGGLRGLLIVDEDVLG